MARLLLDEVLDPRFSDNDADAYRKLVGKAGGELGMLLRLASRALVSEEDTDEIHSLACKLAPLVRSPQLLRTLLFRPSRAATVAVGHLCLTELGANDDRIDRVVRLAMRSSVSFAHERVPYRLLDGAWTRHLAFGDEALEHSAVALSALGVGVDLLEATVEDAYALTHALPYVTDFGRIPLPVGLDAEMLLGIAEALAVKALDDDDLDLLAEVLMAPAISRLGWTPTLQFSWEVLDRVWGEFGFVPGPGLPPPVPGESREEAVRRVLGTVYHTTFAAGLCYATLLSCGATPPVEAHGPPGSVPPPPGKGMAWKVSWERASAKTQRDLQFLALGFTLRRAVEAVDLVEVREIVNQAARSSMIEHPLFIQALELLERVKISSVG